MAQNGMCSHDDIAAIKKAFEKPPILAPTNIGYDDIEMQIPTLLHSIESMTDPNKSFEFTAFAVDVENECDVHCVIKHINDLITKNSKIRRNGIISLWNGRSVVVLAFYRLGYTPKKTKNREEIRQLKRAFAEIDEYVKKRGNGETLIGENLMDLPTIDSLPLDLGESDDAQSSDTDDNDSSNDIDVECITKQHRIAARHRRNKHNSKYFDDDIEYAHKLDTLLTNLNSRLMWNNNEQVFATQNNIAQQIQKLKEQDKHIKNKKSLAGTLIGKTLMTTAMGCGSVWLRALCHSFGGAIKLTKEPEQRTFTDLATFVGAITPILLNNADSSYNMVVHNNIRDNLFYNTLITFDSRLKMNGVFSYQTFRCPHSSFVPLSRFPQRFIDMVVANITVNFADSILDALVCIVTEDKLIKVKCKFANKKRSLSTILYK